MGRVFLILNELLNGLVPDLEELVVENFMKFSDFQSKEASGMMANTFPTNYEKGETHQMMMKIEPLLIASVCRFWRSILLIHGDYPCHCLAQTFWYPKRANLLLLWDAGEVCSMGLPDQVQNVSILVVSAMLAMKWLEANAGTSKQEMSVSVSKKLELLETTCKVLRIPKAIESFWARPKLMTWFCSVMTAWVYMCMNLRSVICSETRRAISHSR